MKAHSAVPIEYFPLPTELNERYQHFTEADLTGLRETGCDFQCTQLEEGIRETFAVEVASR